jgi:hypothetical protein
MADEVTTNDDWLRWAFKASPTAVARQIRKLERELTYLRDQCDVGAAELLEMQRVRDEAQAEAAVAKAALRKAKVCPDCDGQGWCLINYSGPEPEHEQCQVCHGTGVCIPDVPDGTAADLLALMRELYSALLHTVQPRTGREPTKDEMDDLLARAAGWLPEAADADA